MIVLDASAVIAAFYSKDSHHDNAVELLHAHASDGFVVHPLTLAECLVGPARSGHITQVRRQIRAMGIEVYVPDAEEPSLIAEIRANTALKLPDCCVLAVALSLSAPILTFDGRLRAAALEQSIGVVDSFDEV